MCFQDTETSMLIIYARVETPWYKSWNIDLMFPEQHHLCVTVKFPPRLLSQLLLFSEKISEFMDEHSFWLSNCMEVLSFNPSVMMVYTQRFLVDWFLCFRNVVSFKNQYFSQFRERSTWRNSFIKGYREIDQCYRVCSIWPVRLWITTFCFLRTWVKKH